MRAPAISTRPSVSTRRPALLALALCWGCGSAPPTVPPIPEPRGCAIIDPATINASGGPDLQSLRPARGPGKNLPQTVGALLSTRGEPSPAQWRALPPTADAALVEAMEDADRLPVERARAIAGLSLRGQEGAGLRIQAQLADPKTAPMVRRAAARGLADGYLDQAEGALVDALADPDPMLREAVAKALAPHLERPAIKAAFEARRAVEQAPLVKEALDAALEP